MMLKLQDVSFYYDNKLPSPKMVLNKVNLEFGEREFVGIIGPSGSGKTTLIQQFTGLLKPTAGQILIDGINLWSSHIDMDQIRKRIGIAFQFPESQLFEDTVYDDVAFGPRNYGVDENQIEQRAKEIFRLIGIDFDDLKLRPPFKLSEGEKRKVALAGIIVMDPDVLALDEPTACLDAAGVRKIEMLLNELFNLGKSIILISHNLDFIAKSCHRIVFLKDGVVLFDGSKTRFFEEEQWIRQLNLDEPRCVRLSRKLHELGFISRSIHYSPEAIISALTE